MQLRWDHARPAAGAEGRKTKPNRSHNEPGLEGKNAISPSGRGRKMSLTCPLIDQAITRFDPPRPRPARPTASDIPGWEGALNFPIHQAQRQQTNIGPAKCSSAALESNGPCHLPFDGWVPSV